jgi:N-acetylmuramoyl-L-alanine amidase
MPSDLITRRTVLLAAAGTAAAGAGAQRPDAGFELLAPREPRSTTVREFVNVLGRVRPGSTVRVGGEAASVFSTGVFVRDRVPLQPGPNRIEIEVLRAGAVVASGTLEVERMASPPAPAPPPPAAPEPRPLPPSTWGLVIGEDNAELLHGLHEVRLGGPFVADAPPRTRLPLLAEAGEQLRAELAPGFTAWLPKGAVELQPPGTPLPRTVFTSLSVAGHAEGDVISLPLAAPLPYAVTSRTPGELQVDLFGTHLATTWISHRATGTLVREITVEALGDGRVRLHVALHAPRLWGWRVEQVPGAMRIVLRAAPVLPRSGSPLAGLHVALEAGHGGPENTGAIGATGVPEKDINRWTTDALAAELRGLGATVTQVRENDENPTQRERARRVQASGAQLFVSVHANAADTGNGYLRVAGTSTYYKHGSRSRDLAAATLKRLLAETGLADFGLVGNFNYAPLRLTTAMPAMLFEQAFVSHPGDEAKLLDGDFRALMVRSVRRGIEDFLRALPAR